MKIITDTGLTFDLHGPAFAAIALFRSTNETRPQMRGVRVEPLADGGALLVATDGHKLAVYRDGSATAERPLTLKIDKPVSGREDSYFCQENADDYVTWRGVIPPVSTAIETPGLIGLDAKHLKAFGEAAKKLGSFSHLKIARFKDDKKQDCYLVNFNDPDFYGLLMSLIIPRDYAPNFRPAFLDAAPRLAEAGKEEQSMSKLVPFTFENVPVRVVELDGEPWFVGKDVAERLGYANPTDAINQHCKGVAKRDPLSTAGGMQEIRILSEPDVLRLIVGSKLPAAERFEKWVFEEVLPSIRKTGSYGVPQVDPANLSRLQLIELAMQAERERLALEGFAADCRTPRIAATKTAAIEMGRPA